MTSLGQCFKVEELPQNIITPIPDGWYDAVVNSANLLSAKSDVNDKYISIRFDILNPEFAHRSVFDNLNIQNKSATAEEIARKKLRMLMEALGITTLEDTEELRGELKIRVGTEIKENYAPKNEIKEYKACDSIGVREATVTPNETSNSATPPWLKK